MGKECMEQWFKTFLFFSPTCPQCRRVIQESELTYQGPPAPLCTRILRKAHVFLDAASSVLLIMWLTKLPLLRGESESLHVGLLAPSFWAFLTLIYIIMKHTLSCLGKKCVLFPQARVQLWLSAGTFKIILTLFLVWTYSCNGSTYCNVPSN